MSSWMVFTGGELLHGKQVNDIDLHQRKESVFMPSIGLRDSMGKQIHLYDILNIQGSCYMVVFNDFNAGFSFVKYFDGLSMDQLLNQTKVRMYLIRGKHVVRIGNFYSPKTQNP